MITQINSFTLPKAQPKQSFGMAYRTDTRWNEVFHVEKEHNFISTIANKAKNDLLKYTGFDGIAYHFKTFDGEVLYTKESKGMMSNIKFIPNHRAEEGFYIIDTNASKLESPYSKLSKMLNEHIIQNRKKTQHHNPNKILRNFPVRHKQEVIYRYV